MNIPTNLKQKTCKSSKKFWCFFCYFRKINSCPNLKISKTFTKDQESTKKFLENLCSKTSKFNPESIISNKGTNI